MVLPGLGSEPVHFSINCDDGIEIPMIGSHELLCPSLQKLQYGWSYRAADGTWGEPPFQVPLIPGLSVPSLLSSEQAGVFAPGTAHTWLFRVMVSLLVLLFAQFLAFSELKLRDGGHVSRVPRLRVYWR